MYREVQGYIEIRKNVAGLRHVSEGELMSFAASAQGDLWQMTGCGCGWASLERGWVTVVLGTECEG